MATPAPWKKFAKKVGVVPKNMIIYKITNNVNSKIYIWQTTRKLKERIYCHKSSIKFFWKKRRICNALVGAFIKYWFENFTFSIIDDTAKNLTELNTLEKKYIAEYDSVAPNWYNLLKWGLWCYASNVTKDKMSKNHRSKKEWFLPRNRKTYVLIHPNWLEEEISWLYWFCKKNNLVVSCLHKVATWKMSHYKWYKVYKKGWEKLFDKVSRKGSHSIKAVAAYKWDIKIWEYDSIVLCSKILWINRPSISRVCLWQIRTCNGFYFEYI